MKKFLLIASFMIIFAELLSATTTEQTDSTQTLFAPYLRPEYRVSIEYNPGFTLWAGSEYEATIISAGFSWFPANSNIEIAFPILIQHTNETELFQPYDYTGSAITIDVRYRKYLMGKVGGIYNSLGLSYQHLDLTYDSDYDEHPPNDMYHFVANKIGIGAGVGYRIFSDANLNWTIGIFLGRYICMDRSNERLLGTLLFESDGDGILRLQLLKFGFAW